MNKILLVVALALSAAVAVNAGAAIRASKVPYFRWDQFVGKVVLVTGGSSGMGFATALSFARYGARVIIAARDSNSSWFNGADAAKKINEDKDVISLGGYARFVKTDVSIREQVDALIKNIVDHEGTIDFAFNNAGVAGYIGGLHEPGLEATMFSTHDCIRNNVFGVAYCLSAELELWAKQGRGGSIINTASVNAFHGATDAPLYSTSKFAVLGLTMSVALEVAKNSPEIRINALCPGFTDTSLVWQQCKYLEHGQQSWEGDFVNHDHPLWKKYGRFFAEAAPSGKIVDPMDQARMVMYLCSREARYISGAALIVDAGINDEGIDVQN